jgi:hypothetical protein
MAGDNIIRREGRTAEPVCLAATAGALAGLFAVIIVAALDFAAVGFFFEDLAAFLIAEGHFLGVFAGSEDSHFLPPIAEFTPV